METARQTWLAIEAQFLNSNESRVLQLDLRMETSALATTVVG
jgi:hypothetical protein